MHAWFTIGTTAFYWDAPELEKCEREDHLSLVPAADSFNLTGELGAKFIFSSNGLTVSATRKCKAEEELCVLYGDYSNDFLLAEYGFIWPENEHD